MNVHLKLRLTLSNEFPSLVVQIMNGKNMIFRSIFLISENFAFWIVLSLGFGLRLTAVLLVPDYFLFPDSNDYHSIANNYLQNKGLILFDTLYAVRPPLYSLFLAFLYFFGLGPLGVLVVQVFLGTAMIIFQYFLALMLFNRKIVALLASLFLALDPFFILFGALLLTEILFSLIFLCLILLLHRLHFTERSFPWFYAGVLFGVGCLCRDALLGFIVFALFFAFLRPKGFAKAFFLVAGAFVVIFPWTLRNWICLDEIVIITSKKGTNLYEAFGPGATGGCAIMEMNLPQGVKEMNEAQQDRFLTQWTLQYIAQNPQNAIRLGYIKFLRFWNVSLNYEVLKKHPVNAIIILFNVLIYLFAALGFWFSEKKKIFILLCPILYFTLLHLVFLGSVRYRVPIMPYLELLAASGIVVSISSVFSKFKRD